MQNFFQQDISTILITTYNSNSLYQYIEIFLENGFYNNLIQNEMNNSEGNNNEDLNLIIQNYAQEKNENDF